MDPEITRAQAAMEQPDVQEMIERLAEYGLGIYVPHTHDGIGSMAPLPENVMQIERDLHVSFEPADAVTAENDSMPVGWVWDESTRSPRVTMRCC